MQTATTQNTLTDFQWSRQPQAAALVQEILDDFLARCPDARRFAERLRDETGTRFADWIDHIIDPLQQDKNLWQRLTSVGYDCRRVGEIFRHAQGMFPPIFIDPDFPTGEPTIVAIKADSVVDYLVANRCTDGREVVGEPLSAIRRVCALKGDGAEMWVVESHGCRFGQKAPTAKVQDLIEIQESLQLRQRVFDDSTAGFQICRGLIKKAIKRVGVDRAADLFFAAEREYWMSRNHAARVQYARQQALGLGWANHDHHTYRSSRKHFADLIGLLEMLGLQCRERFYAGKEAGWGAQVMEQPNAGIVVFADVDLSDDEVTGDFAHAPLPPRDELGTVGLWCELHGEAVLQAGMHHLECQFNYEAARQQLQETGVQSMKPFTDLPHLKQAFTQGEMWPVDPKRIEALLARKLITPEQAQRFRTEGALGSHLEILQRDEGYKGFNQTGINEIILKTDPRNAGSKLGA